MFDNQSSALVAGGTVASSPDQAVPVLRPVSRKPWELFRPPKPFLNDLYLKPERSTRLKLLVCREPLFIITICD